LVDNSKTLAAIFLHKTIRQLSITDCDSSFYTDTVVQTSPMGYYYGVNCTTNLYFLSPELFGTSTIKNLDLTFGRENPSGIFDVLQGILLMPHLIRFRVRCPTAGQDQFRDICLAKVSKFLAEIGHVASSHRKMRCDLHHRKTLEDTVPWERFKLLYL